MYTRGVYTSQVGETPGAQKTQNFLLIARCPVTDGLACPPTFSKVSL